jgi:hypothetical protein
VWKNRTHFPIRHQVLPRILLFQSPSKMLVIAAIATTMVHFQDSLCERGSPHPVASRSRSLKPEAGFFAYGPAQFLPSTSFLFLQ